METQLSDFDTAQWRDKKRHLWLMGLIAPTAMFIVLPVVWAFNQFGWQTASQVFFWVGPSCCSFCCRRWTCATARTGRTRPTR